MKNLKIIAITSMMFSSLSFMAHAAPPGAAFNGKVTEIFVNNTQILVAVTGEVNGECRGRFGPYNLTFDIADPGAEQKLTLIRDAFLNDKSIAGYLKGCGSSNINKLNQVSVF